MTGNTLGLDLGTSEMKALLMGADGVVLAFAHARLAWTQPRRRGSSSA